MPPKQPSGNLSRVTLVDVAKRAAVSPVTVSRVITGNQVVKEATKIKVNKAIKELKYRPNHAARSLATNRSFLIGAITLPFSGYYYWQLHRGAATACRELGYHLMLEEVDLSMDAGEWYRHSFHKMKLDGLILPPPLCDEPRLLDRLDEDGIAYVRITPGLDPERSPSVRSEDAQGAEALADHLWDQGYRRFAIVVGPSKHAASRQRMDGFVSAIERHGIDRSNILIAGTMWSGDPVANAREIASQLFPKMTQPTALFAFHDELAAALIRIAVEHGLRVPDDLAIAGYDGSEICELTVPSLTTVRQPIAQMARTAVNILVGKDVDRSLQVVHPVTLEVRESTVPACDGSSSLSFASKRIPVRQAVDDRA